MKKTIIFLIFFIFVAPATASYDLCSDRIDVNTNCTFVTGVISCLNYTYNIINSTGSKVVDGENLTHLNSSVYYFNFTQTEGQYVINLCDDSLHKIDVVQEDKQKMIIAIIILLPMLLAFVFMIAAATLGEEHSALKIALFLITPFLFIISGGLAIEGLVEFYNFPELIETIATTNYWLTWFFVVIIIYFLIYLMWKMFDYIAQKKKERLEY